MTRRFRFVTVDVFTDRRFGGNQLAVFPDARGMSDAEMQALAAEFNLSETTFVLPPADPANTARVRIFTRTAELPFAGHPNVGTGHVLAGMGRDGGGSGTLRFEEPAGLVEVRVERGADGAVTGATIAAPQPLSSAPGPSPAVVAACAGLAQAEVITAAHPPTLASVGNPFVVAEVAPEALTRAAPDPAAFRAALEGWQGGGTAPLRLALYLHARTGDPGRVRARMFAPLGGTFEDAATGSAAAPLSALLLSLSGAGEHALEVVQGVEMGRPSLLRTTARRGPDGIRATVGGGCVPVLEGEALL